MSNDSIRRTGKLLRYRKFAEQKAKSSLQTQRKHFATAQEELDASQATLDAASHWKSRLQSEGHLDLEIYQQALRHESARALVVETARNAVDEAEDGLRNATTEHLQARNGMRMVDARLSRVSKHWEDAQERSQSDQLAYLWLTTQRRSK